MNYDAGKEIEFDLEITKYTLRAENVYVNVDGILRAIRTFTF